MIVVCAVRGCKKGFVNTVGSLAAGLLAIVFVYVLNTWAMESLLMTLLADHMLIVVRLILCIALYALLFFALKAILISLNVLARIPVVRGLNKLLGFVAGAVYGVFLVGIIYWIYSWFA